MSQNSGGPARSTAMDYMLEGLNDILNRNADIPHEEFDMSLRLLLVAGSLISTCAAQSNYPPELPGSAEVVYKTVDDIELKMWIYSPEGHNPSKDARPAVVFFFGGGWKSGTPAQFEQQCKYLVSRGMVAATADYRVATRHDVKANACVEDAKSAVRWVRKNAGRLGVDPERICAAGGSAGGHTACCTSLIKGMDNANEDKDVSSVPNAMALFNPAVMLAELTGFGKGDIPDEKIEDIATRTGVPAEQISPIHHVRTGLPPTIIFHGTNDDAVPYTTVQEFTKRMIAAGNRCDLKTFHGAPHGFFNAPRGNNAARRDQSDQRFRRTMLQLDTFLQSLGWLQGDASVRAVDNDFVSLRGHVQNSYHKFAVEKRGHVAFLGGSITEMNGYRPLIAKWLEERFPETDFTFTNAGISSTCSTSGAFRLERDVLKQGPVDLLFVEFAVNDDQDAAHSAENCVRGMEGIIQRTREHNPRADIVMTHFVNPGMLNTLNGGKDILSASHHEAVARHYNVSSVYLSKAVAHQINAGELTWKQFGGTHPGPRGNHLAADLAVSILDAGWRGLTAENSSPAPHNSPGEPLNATSYNNGRFLPMESVRNVNGWSHSEPEWKQIPGSKRSRFVGVPLFHADNPGSEAVVSFNGTAIGAFVVAGPDAGRVEFRIDNGEWKNVDLYHRFSKGLHYPRTVMFESDLPDSSHTVTVRIAKPEGGRGSAARIVGFVVNGPRD